MSQIINQEEPFSRRVKAGKRTYFFDVKPTRADDFYITITESKKRTLDDGQVAYDKHKIFLYKEDFAKFIEGFTAAVECAKDLMPDYEYHHKQRPSVEGEVDPD